MSEIEITPASLELFHGFCEDAPNWSGSPLVSVSKAQEGNLTHLKKLGLLDTFVDEGCSFVVFTEKGVAFAETLGYDRANLLFA